MDSCARDISSMLYSAIGASSFDSCVIHVVQSKKQSSIAPQRH